MRLTTAKQVTIQRLELTAAGLDWTMKTQNIYHTDSKVVFGYISNESNFTSFFFVNRVQQIKTTQRKNWNYIETNNNPAVTYLPDDYAQRPTENEPRWNGPKILSSTEPQLSKNNIDLANDDP